MRIDTGIKAIQLTTMVLLLITGISLMALTAWAFHVWNFYFWMFIAIGFIATALSSWILTKD